MVMTVYDFMTVVRRWWAGRDGDLPQIMYHPLPVFLMREGFEESLHPSLHEMLSVWAPKSPCNTSLSVQQWYFRVSPPMYVVSLPIKYHVFTGDVSFFD